MAIDEQHKFGVHQRLLLTSKNNNLLPDILLMTATPIPRTLELTTYGSMSVSKITEKPVGRQSIKTAAKPITKLEETIISLKKTIKQNKKIYWVCPLIEESEKIDLAAAQQRYEALEGRLTKIEEKVDSIHKDVVEGQKSMTKVLIGAAGTIVAGLLSTIIVLVMNL